MANPDTTILEGRFVSDRQIRHVDRLWAELNLTKQAAKPIARAPIISPGYDHPWKLIQQSQQTTGKSAQDKTLGTRIVAIGGPHARLFTRGVYQTIVARIPNQNRRVELNLSGTIRQICSLNSIDNEVCTSSDPLHEHINGFLLGR